MMFRFCTIRAFTWVCPILLGLISLVGLLCGLLDDGWWDVASWVLLGLIVAVCGLFGLLPDRPAQCSKEERARG